MLFGGGSSTSSQSLSNAITFNPLFNIGDANRADSTTKQKTDASATAETKDEFGLSASVGVGLGGSGSGGTATLARSGDTQPMAQTTTSDNGFFKDNLLKDVNPVYIVGGAVVAIGAYFILSKKKKSK